MSAHFAIPVHTPPSKGSPIAQAQKPRLKCQADGKTGDDVAETKERRTPVNPNKTSQLKL